MIVDILNLIIWPRDKNKEPRVLSFKPNSINLITGTSKTGKTSIIEILDYCLGSGSCSIPKRGPIRHSSSWYGILINTSEGQKLLARRDPENQDSTDDYYLVEGIIENITKWPEKNANREYVNGMLSRLAKLPQSNSDFSQTGSGFKGRPSFGDLTAFVFQPQNIIANKNTMFYQADDEDHARKLKEIFPLILGVIDSDTLIKQHRLQEVRRMLERKRRQLEALKLDLQEFNGEVRGRYIAAIELGLCHDNENNIEHVDVNVLLQRLKDVLLRWEHGHKEFSNKTVSFLGSERLSTLHDQEANLSAELSTLRIRLTQLRELYLTRQSLESNLARERDRLGPVSWIMEKLEKPHNCPICGSNVEEINDEISYLKETTQEVEALWHSINIVPPMLDAEEVEIRKAIQKNEDLIRQIRLEIQQIEQERDINRVTREQRSVYIGRLEEFFRVQRSISDDGNITKEMEKLEEEEELLLESVDPSVIAQRKEAALFQVSRFAQPYGIIMQIETGDDLIQLDTSKLTIRVIGKDGQIAWLREIGSAANWLGYHVATLLALQELFFYQNIPYVPSLFVLDQPSQTHFPDDTDEEAENEEFEAVKKVFKACSKAIDRLKGNLQVIITDHTGGSAVRGVEHVFVVERWRKGRKLIPWHWHPEALKVCIEQGSTADYALDDIKVQVLRPAVIEFLGLASSTDLVEIEIQDSSFVSKGIRFCIRVTSEVGGMNYILHGVVNSDLGVEFLQEWPLEPQKGNER